MPTAAKKGTGVTLTRAGYAVAEITDIGGVELTQETIDATGHGSANDYREFIGGLINGGTVAIKGNFIPSDANGQLGLKSDLDSHTLQNFVITLPPAFGVSWTFTALVTKFAIRSPMDGIVTFEAELQISGKPTLGITASNDLSGLSIATGTLYPTFAGATYSYVATTTDTSVTVTATFSAGTCVLKVNGGSPQTLTSGVASSAINAGAAGTVTTLTLEITEAGKTTKTYTIYLTKTA